MKQNFRWLGAACFLFLAFTACSDDNKSIETPEDDFGVTENTVTISKPSTEGKTEDKGFYVLNEDWFGHDNGTINQFNADGTIKYRAFRAANPGEQFGITAQYGAFFGENLYVMSKQGNRLVVANKETLKTVAIHPVIGGDGRGFVGINEEKAYFSTSNGVKILDIKTSELGKDILDEEGNPVPEVGNMVHAGNYVFATGRSKTFVIDTEQDLLVKVLDINNPGSVVQSKDGSVWVGNPESLYRINIETLEYEAIQDISGGGVSGTWFAWNKGSFSASNTENALYWTSSGMFSGGSTIYKYDIDSKSIDKDFFTLGTDADHGVEKDFGNESTSATKLSFYGGTINVNPLNGKIYATVKRDGWGDNGSYNWVFIINKEGELEKSIVVADEAENQNEAGPSADRYYWFPAMPLFNDYYSPEVLLDKVELVSSEPVLIDLSEITYDFDNIQANIQVSVELKKAEELFEYKIKDNKLEIIALKSGETSFTVKAVSNGVAVSKDIVVRIKL